MKSLILKINQKRSQTVYSRIEPYLNSTQNVIDIGSGIGNISLLVKQKVKSVTPVDVANFHNVRALEPFIYDGKTLPFADNSFDLALVLMVMHHTPDPVVLLKEAKRVSKEIVVIETSYSNWVHKIYTVFMDALFNLQFPAGWNSYKSDSEWKSLFASEGLQVVESRRFWDAEMFLHVLYYLKCS